MQPYVFGFSASFKKKVHMVSQQNKALKVGMYH